METKKLVKLNCGIHYGETERACRKCAYYATLPANHAENERWTRFVNACETVKENK